MSKKVGFKLLLDGEEKKMDDANNLPDNLPDSLPETLGTPMSSTSSPSILHTKKTPSPSIIHPKNSLPSIIQKTTAPSSKQQKMLSTTNQDNNATRSKKMFRLPKVFRKSRRTTQHNSNSNSNRNNTSTINQDTELEEDEGIGGEQLNDPVMTVFQNRLNPRVRWSLDCQPVAEKYAPEKKFQDTKANDQKDDSTSASSPASSSSARDMALAVPSTSTAGSSKSNNSSSSSNIKKFVTGALFGGKSASEKEFQKEVEKEVEAERDLVWESNTVCPEGGGEVCVSSESQPITAFSEDPKIKTAVKKLILKGKRAQSEYFRYEHAVKYFVRAHDMLTDAKYPDMHPTVRKTLDLLNDAHHKLSSFNNSANIVKIGIKYEDSGELVRALKMYSIAYRIRRDNLSRSHPSLVVLLNMLGSIQTKRGEYEEAMKIYELALKDSTNKQDHNLLDSLETPTPTASSSASVQEDCDDDNDDDQSQLPPPPPPVLPPSQSETEEQTPKKSNLLAKSVTYREMGTIFEKWDRLEQALKMYHLSLDCVAQWKEDNGVSAEEKGLQLLKDASSDDDNTKDDEIGKDIAALDQFMDNVRVKKSYANEDKEDNDEQSIEKGDMEMEVGVKVLTVKTDVGIKTLASSISTYYDSFFPPHLEAINARKGRSTAAAAAMACGDSEGLDRRDDYADIDVALTIHQIAQLFRKQGQFSKSLEAYAVALRGMKYSLGNYHPNVAAILGNFGNLQKEMGDLNAAYDTYQEVLGIESYRLGLSHPDVAITLHNIATIDSARGNHERALKLYEQVMSLQEKLFGEDHISIAVTSACMGDAYEALGQMKDAFESYEDALRIKSAFQGQHSLEVARILHKLAKVALKRGDHRLACTYISKAIFAYRLNKKPEDHEWVIDGHRDSADIDASIALAKDITFEC